MNAWTIGSKVVGSLVTLAALSTLSGCVVEARPMPARAVYVEPSRAVYVAPGRAVYVEPARPYRRYYY
jgi:hypothetical protein